MLKVSSNTLQQVQKFSTWVVFTSEGRQSKEIDRRISKTNTVLHVIYLSVVTKRELSIIAKLSAFKSVFVPILTYGHESWAMAQRALSQVQTTEMEFLRKVYGVTLRDKVRSCENLECTATFRETLNVQPLLIRTFWPCDQNAPGKTGEMSPAASAYTYGKAVQRSTKDQVV